MIATCLITFRAQNRGTFGVLSIYEWNEIAVLQKVQIIGCDGFNPWNSSYFNGMGKYYKFYKLMIK